MEQVGKHIVRRGVPVGDDGASFHDGTTVQPVGLAVEIVTSLTVTCVTSVTGYRYRSFSPFLTLPIPRRPPFPQDDERPPPTFLASRNRIQISPVRSSRSVSQMTSCTA